MFQTVHHQQQGGSGAAPMVSPHHHHRLDSFPHHGSEAGNLMELLQVHAPQGMGNNSDLMRNLGENVMGKAGPSGGGGVAGSSSALDLHHRHHHHHHHRPGLHQQNLEPPRKSSWADPTKGASPSPALWMLHDHAETPELPKLPLSMLPEAGTGRTDERAGGSRMPAPQQSMWRPKVEKEMGSLPRLMVVEPDRPLHSEVFGLGMDMLSPRGAPNDMAEGDVKMVDSSDCSDHNLDEHEEKNVGGGHTVMGRAVSKNLVSERKRRKKLNEGMLTLRSLVPRISKMDKASIIGDAIDYVQDLQKQVEVLQSGISEMEASAGGEQPLSLPMADPTTIPKVETLCPELDVGKFSSKNVPERNVLDLVAESAEQKILELDVSLLEDQIYHLQIFCTKGPGVFVQLMQTLEALGLEVVNANLMSLQGNILNIFIAEIKDWETMKVEDVKKAIMDVASRFGLQ